MGAAVPAARRLPITARWLVVGVHDGNDAALAWDASQRFLGAAWETAQDFPRARAAATDAAARCLNGSVRAGQVPAGEVRGLAGYMRSGTGMPSRPSPVMSTRRVSADSASLLCRMDGSGACSTGHCS